MTDMKREFKDLIRKAYYGISDQEELKKEKCSLLYAAV